MSAREDPALGWLEFRAERSLFPLAAGIVREWDAGEAPSIGCLVLADDGMLGASPLLLAGAV